MPHEQQEGCSHTDTQILWPQGTIKPSVVERKVESEASSSVESEMIDGRPFFRFL
jgi:hypothetical protein